MKNDDVELPECVIKSMNSELGHCASLLWWE